MNAGKAVYGILSANSGVTDLVSTRIFPEIAEQEAATPFIVYQLQSVAPEDTHDGPSKLDEVRFEFLCYADTYDTAADVGVKVRAALDRVSGTYNGVNVESVQFNDVDIEIEYQPRRYSQVLKFTFRIKRDDFTIAQGTPVTGAQLGQLADVDVDGVTNGQLIAYNSTSGNWEAADDATGNNTLTGLTDTSITTPADRESLIYDSGNWVNDNLTKSDVGLANVDNTSDANKPISSATQTALNAKADTSAVPTELNDLSDVTITGTPSSNEALIFDTATSSFKSLPNFTNRFEDDAENNKPATPFGERVFTVKADGDGIFLDAQSDTPTAGKVIERKIYHKAGFVESGDAIGDFTLIHTFADDTAYAATTSTFEGFRDGDTYGTPPFTLLQTWEEADAFTGLLDTYSGAAAAYSLRRLRTAYTGDAVRVRRSNDNAEADIGFSNNELDTTALAAHCGSNDGFVKTWYDQSGNTNDATQTSTGSQPKIYDGTTGVVTENGKPALQMSSNSIKLAVPSSKGTFKFLHDGSNSSTTWVVSPTDARETSGTTDHELFETGEFTSSVGVEITYRSSQFSGTENAEFEVKNGSSKSVDFRTSNGAFNVGQNLCTFFIDADNSTAADRLKVGLNGNTLQTGNTQTAAPSTADSQLDFTIYGGFTAHWQEIVVWNSDQSSNRTGIESNINTFYSIF